LIVVPTSEEGLYHYLRARFAADTGTHVILDRRRRDATAGRPLGERRASHSTDILSSQRVAVIRLTAGATVHEPAGQEGAASMEGIEGLENRQRVDRWLEESQYLIGRLVPAYMEDRDRVRARLEVVEQDNERLRLELGEARREIAELREDLESHRAERAGVADTFGAIVEHLAALQKPVNDISRRLHAVPGSPSEIKV
jgi:1,6-anhydro-N-acetylmuramate kinase